ncbi:hypothetical protein EUGRSUZ_A01528 [Eucalyptus grandis]|uniref:Uncharacterized protein n=2 Tax=Eucalyptus grandis TaxID=71139 RepID=A0ACC3M3L8_EUCGR|nr:hypothetical protein EUGRSUZ_A01528 [Eucalyptus grandis]
MAFSHPLDSIQWLVIQAFGHFKMQGRSEFNTGEGRVQNRHKTHPGRPWSYSILFNQAKIAKLTLLELHKSFFSLSSSSCQLPINRCNWLVSPQTYASLHTKVIITVQAQYLPWTHS